MVLDRRVNWLLVINYSVIGMFNYRHEPNKWTMVEDSSISRVSSTASFTANFPREHPEQGRWMTGGYYVGKFATLSAFNLPYRRYGARLDLGHYWTLIARNIRAFNYIYVTDRLATVLQLSSDLTRRLLNTYFLWNIDEIQAYSAH